MVIVIKLLDIVNELYDYDTKITQKNKKDISG